MPLVVRDESTSRIKALFSFVWVCRSLGKQAGQNDVINDSTIRNNCNLLEKRSSVFAKINVEAKINGRFDLSSASDKSVRSSLQRTRL